MNLETKWCGKVPGYRPWQIQGLSSHGIAASGQASSKYFTDAHDGS